MSDIFYPKSQIENSIQLFLVHPATPKSHDGTQKLMIGK